jgi:hypothetical protein
MRFAIIAAVALTAGLGAAGCSGGTAATGAAAAGTASKSAPRAPISKAEFVAKANAICASADPGLSVAEAKLASHPTAAQVAALVKGTYIPSVEAQITAIAALGVPSGGQAAVTSMTVLVQADLNRLRSDPALVGTDVFGDFARVAHQFGLTACAPLS